MRLAGRRFKEPQPLCDDLIGSQDPSRKHFGASFRARPVTDPSYFSATNHSKTRQ